MFPIFLVLSGLILIQSVVLASELSPPVRLEAADKLIRMVTAGSICSLVILLTKNLTVPNQRLKKRPSMREFARSWSQSKSVTEN